MKKIFLICLLIIATQFVFAGPTIWIKTDKNNINKKTVDLGAIYNSDKGKDTVDLGAIYNSDKGKDTVDLGAIYNSDKGKDTVNLNFRDISTDNPNNPVNDIQLRGFCYNNLDYSTDKPNNPVNDNQLRGFCYNNLDYSTDNTNKDALDLIPRRFSTDNQNGEYLSTKDKNAEIEKQLKQILLYTPCNKKDKVSLIKKIENLFIKNRNF